MKFKKYPSLARAAYALRKQGFNQRFNLEDNYLRLRESGRLYAPDEVAIVEYHRFLPKGPNRERTSIIVALEAIDGQRGLLIATYNTYRKVNLLKFMDLVKIKSRGKEGQTA